MLSFHNDATIKAKYIARVEAHRIADEIVQGEGFKRNGKVRACAIGCTLDAYDHSRYPVELGLPEWFAHLEDRIHENVPLERAKLWPGQVLDAIPIGVNIELVKDQLAILRLERLLPALIANKEPYARECENALRGVIAFLQQRLGGEFANDAAYSAAYSTAYSAAEAAYSTAYSAAYSARSAAYSARSAADSAVDSAYSAARSAYSAYSAYSAAWQLEADTLLMLLRQCGGTL